MFKKVSRKNKRSSKSRRLSASRSRSKRSLGGGKSRRSARPTRRNRSIRRRMRGGVKTEKRTKGAASAICSAAKLTVGTLPSTECIEEIQFNYEDDAQAKFEAKRLAKYV
jgi:hypothetical protein